MAKKASAPKRAKNSDKNNDKTTAPRILIVEARYYQHIADALLVGAKRVLDEAGASHVTLTVPGALEVPAAIAIALEAGRKSYDGVVALGCVIQGETYHFDLVSNESARGLMEIAINERIPLGNGILTVDNEAQALARASAGDRNKGAEAARAALAMVALKRNLGA